MLTRPAMPQLKPIKAALRSSGSAVRAGLPSYALAVAATLAMLGGHLAFAPWFGDRPLLILFVVPILLSTYLGGAGPGLAATAVLALGAVYFQLPPTYSLPAEKPVETLHWLILIVSGALISLLARLRRRRLPDGSSAPFAGDMLAAERKVGRGFGLTLVVVALLGLLGAIAVLSVSRLREQSAWEAHTHTVISSLGKVLALTVDIETAERGYLLNGAENYLDRHQTARRALPGELQSLRDLTADNPHQQKQLDLLGPLITERLARSDAMIGLRREKGLAAVQAMPDQGQGKRMQDQIRELVSGMEATEQVLLRDRETRARHISVTTRTIVIGGGTLAFAFVAMALYMMNQEFAGRHRLEHALRLAESELTVGHRMHVAMGVSHDELELRVAERTAELNKANQGLSEEIAERRRTEAALLRAKARTESVLAGMTDIYFVIDEGWHYLYANEAALGTIVSTAGVPRDEVLNRTLWELFPALVGTEMDRQLRRTMKGRVPVEFDFHHAAAGAWWHYRAYPAADGAAVFASDITASKRNEEALRRQRAELRVLFDLMPAMLWFKDTENRILRVNQRVADDAGKSIADIEGRVASEIYPGEAAKFFADDLEVIAAGVPRLGVVEPLHAASGAERWMQTDKVPVRDRDGKVSGIVVMAQDVTERRQAEESILHNLSMQRIAGRLSRVGAWSVELPGLRLIWSDEVCAMHEVPPGFTTTVADVVSFYAPEFRDVVARTFQACVSDGTPFDIEVQIVTARGRRVWVRSIGEAERDTAGIIQRVHGAFQDIDDRKQGVEALRLSEQRFKTLFEQAAVGVAVAEAATGKFVQVNQHFCAVAGRSREELEQLTFAAITDPRDIASSREAAERMRAGAIREHTCEQRYLRKEGGAVWIDATISAMWAPGETPNFLIAVVQDITGRRQLEEQFRQTQKLEAIGTLAGGIAHDFNNILAAVNGYTELSRMILIGNPQVRDHLDAVLRASARATALIRQILMFSRQQPLERRPIRLHSVVAECLALLRATLPSTIEFETTLAMDAPTVLADATQIHQILMNLGTNAWHAMKDRPGQLRVTLERCVVDDADIAGKPSLRAGLYTRISVGDSGTGMSPETQRRIFEPFFTTKPVGEGTGLGLPVVHGIMDSHEGLITVYSQPGEGTVFHLYFPAHVGGAILAAAEPEAVPRGRGERILFVDDEELLTQLGQKTLTALGYVVEIATRPAAALALVRAEPERFALVLTDQTMPEMTGMALAGQLKQLRPGLPIILMTGYSSSLNSERLEAAGIRQLLLKPTSVHSLGAAVHAAVTGKPPTHHGTNPPY